MAYRLVVLSLLFLSGCLWPVRRDTDRTVADLSNQPYDVAPRLPPRIEPAKKESETPSKKGEAPIATDIMTTRLMVEQPPEKKKEGKPTKELEIPTPIPGASTPRVVLPRDPAAARKEIERLFPPLPPLPVEVAPQPGPNGVPYTLADFQRLAVDNSPTLRQAASDVEAARGALVQASTYPNPNFTIATQATNNNSIGGAKGGAVDQRVITGGKMRMAVAAAQKNFDNAELALRRARSDLSTAVRNAFYAFLVARETMIVNKGLSEFTDMIYRRQVELMSASLAAPHEPAALRASAYTARLSYKQSISVYIYAWKQLVSTVGLRQLPLSEVEGRIDRLIPYFDYDEVLRYALENHTDVLTARNAVDIGKYNLKIAQITPLFPDVDVNVSVFKDTTLSPFGMYHTFSLTVPLPLWDQNKGNIIAAHAALIRASEESHRVEVTLTNNLAAAYANYKTNLDALEYYRRYILPDQVRYYRGVLNRREVDQTSAFGDLVQAQQTLASNVTTYLGILGSLWSASISVADFLQTNDLFQQGRPMELPPLPSLDELPQWPCPHPDGVVSASCAAAAPQGQAGAVLGARPSVLPPTAAGVPGLPGSQPVGTLDQPVEEPVSYSRPWKHRDRMSEPVKIPNAPQ